MKHLLAVMTVIALCAARTGAAPPPIAVGKPFPQLTLPSLDGEPMSIRDFRGRKVMLHVFASW